MRHCIQWLAYVFTPGTNSSFYSVTKCFTVAIIIQGDQQCYAKVMLCTKAKNSNSGLIGPEYSFPALQRIQVTFCQIGFYMACSSSIKPSMSRQWLSYKQVIFGHHGQKN